MPTREELLREYDRLRNEYEPLRDELQTLRNMLEISRDTSQDPNDIRLRLIQDRQILEAKLDDRQRRFLKEPKDSPARKALATEIRRIQNNIQQLPQLTQEDLDMAVVSPDDDYIPRMQELVARMGQIYARVQEIQAELDRIPRRIEVRRPEPPPPNDDDDEDNDEEDIGAGRRYPNPFKRFRPKKIGGKATPPDKTPPLKRANPVEESDEESEDDEEDEEAHFEEVKARILDILKSVKKSTITTRQQALAVLSQITALRRTISGENATSLFRALQTTPQYNHLLALSSLRGGKGRKGRRAYPEEEYSSSESSSDSEGGGRKVGGGPKRRRGMPDMSGWSDERIREWAENAQMEAHDKIILKPYGEDGLSDREIDHINAVLLTVLIPTRTNAEEVAIAEGTLKSLKDQLANPEAYYDEDGNYLEEDYNSAGWFSDSDLGSEGSGRRGGLLIQPINKKPAYMFGGSIVQPVNAKFLPFF